MSNSTIKTLACASVLALLAGAAHAQNHSQEKTLLFDINLGGVGPLGKTGGEFDSSFLIGGGMSIPITKWWDFDAVNLDAGFGTAGKSRTVLLADNSRRSTANFQGMFATGSRFYIPFGRSGSALSLGGGLAWVTQEEYARGRTSYQGNLIVQEKINCYSCFSGSSSGTYIAFGLSERWRSREGLSLNFRYYMMSNPTSSKTLVTFPTVNQRWLTGSLTFRFGI